MKPERIVAVLYGVALAAFAIATVATYDLLSGAPLTIDEQAAALDSVGKAALSAGDPQVAVKDFEIAQALRSTDPLVKVVFDSHIQSDHDLLVARALVGFGMGFAALGVGGIIHSAAKR